MLLLPDPLLLLQDPLLLLPDSGLWQQAARRWRQWCEGGPGQPWEGDDVAGRVRMTVLEAAEVVTDVRKAVEALVVLVLVVVGARS